MDFDGAVYANVGAGVDGPGSAAGPTQEWIVPPAVQEPSPQRWDIPQLYIDIDQLDVEGLNLTDNPGGAASPTPPTRAAPSMDLDGGFGYADIDGLDSVKAPGWSEPPGGPSRASPKLETGGAGAGWVDPDVSPAETDTAIYTEYGEIKRKTVVASSDRPPPQPGDPSRKAPPIKQYEFLDFELEKGADGVSFVTIDSVDMALVDEGRLEVVVYEGSGSSRKLMDPNSFDVRMAPAPNSDPSPRQTKVSDWTLSLGGAAPPDRHADFADIPGGDTAYNRIYGADPDRKTWTRLPVPGESNHDAHLALHYGKSAGEAGVSIDPSDVSTPAVIRVDGVNEPLYATVKPKTKWAPIPEYIPGLSDDLIRVDGDDAHIYATMESPSTLAGGLPEDDLDDGMLAIDNISAVVNDVMREVELDAGSAAVVDDGFGKRIYATVNQGTPPERSTEYLETALDGSATHDSWGASGSRFSGQSGGDGLISPAMLEQAELSGNAIMDDGLSRMLAQPEPPWTELSNDLWPSKLDEMQSEWMDDTLRYAGPEAVEDARPAAATPPLASPAPVNEASNRLPANFDQQGALFQIDEQITEKRYQISQLTQSSPGSPELTRMQWELETSLLARDELAQGRDPSLVLLARAEKLEAQRFADGYTGGVSEFFWFKPDPDVADDHQVARYADHTPVTKSPNGYFYQEKQSVASGLCGMHAMNAYVGGPVVGAEEFKSAVITDAATKIGMSAEDYRIMIADDFSSDPASIANILSGFSDEGRVSPIYANNQVESGIRVPSPGSDGYDAVAAQINAYPGDRMVVGYSLGHGSDAHMVALRRGTNGGWVEVNSLQIQQADIPDLAAYIAKKTKGSGAAILHPEPNFSFGAASGSAL